MGKDCCSFFVILHCCRQSKQPKKVHLKKSLLVILSLPVHLLWSLSAWRDPTVKSLSPCISEWYGRLSLDTYQWCSKNRQKWGGGKKQSSLSLNLLNSMFSVKTALMSEDPIPTLTRRALSHPSGFHKLQITGKPGNVHSPALAELPKHQLYK